MSGLFALRYVKFRPDSVCLHTCTCLSFVTARNIYIERKTIWTHTLYAITSFSALTKIQNKNILSTLDSTDIEFALCSAHFTQESVCARRKPRQRGRPTSAGNWTPVSYLLVTFLLWDSCVPCVPNNTVWEGQKRIYSQTHHNDYK
jgi:hypothetical protein